MSRRLTIACAAAIVLVAAGLRATRVAQSLWLDEMTTLVRFVRQPWAATLAGGAGTYLPNNHVLHTIVAKLANRAFGTADGPPREWALRLPSVAAGSLLPIALAWPLRRRTPLLAVAVATVAAVHPWLLVTGSEARGYSLMLLFGVIATNTIPTADSTWRGVVGYALAVAAAIYTVPLAAVLVPAHAAAVLARRPAAPRPWLAGVTLAAAVSVAAYAPMRAGLVAYYQDPFPPTMTVAGFAAAVPGHAVAAARLPPAASAVVVAVVLLGTAVGLRRVPDARPLLVTLAVATGIGVAAPLAIPALAEVRFVTWAAPWFCLAAVLLASGRPTVMAICTVALLVPLEWWDAHLTADEPVREAMRAAAAVVPADHPVVVLYVGADDAAACYGPAVETDGRWLTPVDSVAGWSDQTTGGQEPPWVVILFEGLAHDRAAGDAWSAQVTRLLHDDYQLRARLPGRVSPVSIYQPKPAAKPDDDS